jgi:hypothetical protein
MSVPLVDVFGASLLQCGKMNWFRIRYELCSVPKARNDHGRDSYSIGSAIPLRSFRRGRGIRHGKIK